MINRAVIKVEPEILIEFERYCFDKHKDLDNKDSFRKTLAEIALYHFRKGWFARMQTCSESAKDE